MRSFLHLIAAAALVALGASSPASAQRPDVPSRSAIDIFGIPPAEERTGQSFCALQRLEGVLEFVHRDELEAARVPAEVLDEICGDPNDAEFVEEQIALIFGTRRDQSPDVLVDLPGI